MKALVVHPTTATYQLSDKGIHWGLVHCPFCDMPCHVYGSLAGEIIPNEPSCEHEYEIIPTSGYEIVVTFKRNV